MKENELVEQAWQAAQEILAPPLSIDRGAALLYAVTVDQRLNLTVDPKRPRRGRSAFETDLCVFEAVDDGIRIPRVVLEFKAGITSHDVITYSVKARRHKQVYPYLRYGLVIAREAVIPDRVFRHNEALDFVVAAAGFSSSSLYQMMRAILKEEIEASRILERITGGDSRARVFRTAVVIDDSAGGRGPSTAPNPKFQQRTLKMPL